MLKKILLSTCVVLGLATSLSVATDYALSAQTVEIPPSVNLISAVRHTDSDPFATAPVDPARIYTAFVGRTAPPPDAPSLRFLDRAAAGGVALGRFIIRANLLVVKLATCGGVNPACDTRLKISGSMTPTTAPPSRDPDTSPDPLAGLASRDSILSRAMGAGGLGIGFSVDNSPAGAGSGLFGLQPNPPVLSAFATPAAPTTAPPQTGSQRGARVTSTGQPAAANLSALAVAAPTISAVPVPASFALLIGGLAVLGGLRACRRRPPN